MLSANSDFFHADLIHAMRFYFTVAFIVFLSAWQVFNAHELNYCNTSASAVPLKHGQFSEKKSRMVYRND